MFLKSYNFMDVLVLRSTPAKKGKFKVRSLGSDPGQTPRGSAVLTLGQLRTLILSGNLKFEINVSNSQSCTYTLEG